MHGSIMKGEILEADFTSSESQQVFYEHIHKMEVSSESNNDATCQPVMSLIETTIPSTRSEHVCVPFSNPLSDSLKMPQLSSSNNNVKASACELKAEENYLERPQSSNSSNSDSFHTVDQMKYLGNRIEHQLSSFKTDIISAGSYKQPPSKYRIIDINSEIKPSDIVKTILAKPSVFDEDAKRLKHLSEKYVPKQLNLPQISFDENSIYRTPIGSSSQFLPSSSVSLLPPATIITNDQPNNMIQTCPTDLKLLPHGSKLLTKTKLAPVNHKRSLNGMIELFSTHQNTNDWSDSTIDSKYFSPSNSVSSGEGNAQTLNKGNTCQIYTKNWVDSLEESNEKTFQSKGISDYQRLNGSRGEEKLNEKQISKQSSSVQFSGEIKRPSETIVHSSLSLNGIQEKKTNNNYSKKLSEQKNIVNRKIIHESVSTISDEKKACYLPFKKRMYIKQNFIDPDHVQVQEKSCLELKEKGSTSKESKIINNQQSDFNMFETNFNKNVKNCKSMNIEKKIDLPKMNQKLEIIKKDLIKDTNNKMNQIPEVIKEDKIRDTNSKMNQKPETINEHKIRDINNKMNQKPETIKEDKIKDTNNKTYIQDNVSKLKEKSLDELGTDFSTLNKRKTRSSSRLNDLNKSNTDDKNSKGNNKKNCSISKISDSQNKINTLENISKKKKVNKKMLNEEVEIPSTSTSTSEIVLYQPYVSMYDKVKARSSRRIQK